MCNLTFNQVENIVPKLKTWIGKSQASLSRYYQWQSNMAVEDVNRQEFVGDSRQRIYIKNLLCSRQRWCGNLVNIPPEVVNHFNLFTLPKLTPIGRIYPRVH